MTLSKEWLNTKIIYLDWLSKTKLKKIFANNIFYNRLSLWWLTGVYEKDALKDFTWFDNLHKRFNYSKKEKINNEINVFFEFLKLILKLIKIILLNIFIKIFYNDKYSIKNTKKNCAFVVFPNLVKYKNYFLDIQYGLFTSKDKKLSYAIQFDYDFSLITNFLNIKKKLRKIPVDYYIINRYLSIREILRIYFYLFKYYFFLNNTLKKKNYFILKNINCEDILKPLLLKSFLGPIQYSLMNGLSFANLFKKHKFKNFISYLEFFPTSRSVYYFLKKETFSKVNIISVNHANYSDNMLAFAIRKSDFSNSADFLNYSPSPDVFCTQGDKYFLRLKKIFPNKKIFKIGSLKFGMQDIDINEKKTYLRKKIKSKKKIISIFTSTKDYYGIVDILNNCDLSSFLVVLRPHPYYSESTLTHFKKYFKFEFKLMDKFSPRELIKSSDIVLAGDSSLCYESLILGKKKTIRLYNDKYHPLFDAEDEVLTVKKAINLEKYLFEKKKIKKIQTKKLIKDFFYKYDKKAHKRLKNILKKI